MTDQIATASICSRRFRGICAGTKLHVRPQNNAQPTVLPPFKAQKCSLDIRLQRSDGVRHVQWPRRKLRKRVLQRTRRQRAGAPAQLRRETIDAVACVVASANANAAAILDIARVRCG